MGKPNFQFSKSFSASDELDLFAALIIKNNKLPCVKKQFHVLCTIDLQFVKPKIRLVALNDVKVIRTFSEPVAWPGTMGHSSK